MFSFASFRLDPTVAYPVPLRPSVFQHARFIDKMQPNRQARVKQEKPEVCHEEQPLAEGELGVLVSFNFT